MGTIVFVIADRLFVKSHIERTDRDKRFIEKQPRSRSLCTSEDQEHWDYTTPPRTPPDQAGTFRIGFRALDKQIDVSSLFTSKSHLFLPAITY